MTVAAQITGGAVEYTKPSNYQANIAGAKVSLTFMVAEGAAHDDAVAMLDAVAALAIRKAVEMSDAKLLASIPSDPNAFTTNAPPSNPVIAMQATTPALPSLATLHTAADVAAAPVPIAGQVTLPTTHNGPTLVRPHGAAVNIETGAMVPAAPITELIHPLPPASPAEIADKVLSDAVTAKVHAMMQAASDTEKPQVVVRINKFVAHFVAPPQKVYAIPQEQRQTFLDMLSKLSITGAMPYEAA